MITTQTVGNTLLAAQLKAANMVLANIVSLQGGALSVNWNASIKATRGINVINNKLSIGDIASPSFQAAYSCLTGFVGTFAGGPIDPNAQNPGVVIDVEASGVDIISISKSQTNLIEDGVDSGNWYLPFLDGSAQPFATGVNPFSLTIDGVGIELQPNYNFSPMRLYGFANNDTQVIILKVI